MNEMITFLNARLDEEERLANAAIHAGLGIDIGPDGQAVSAYPAAQDHIATWNPARVLREVAFKRVTVKRHVPIIAGYGPLEDQQCCAAESSDEDMWYANPWPCSDILALAAVYSDHPDYRDEWKP